MKWCGLDYVEATWEYAEDLHSELDKVGTLVTAFGCTLLSP